LASQGGAPRNSIPHRIASLGAFIGQQGGIMRATFQTIHRAAGISAILLSLACSDSTGPGGPKVGAVIVTASRTVLGIGDSVQLVATVLDEGGIAMSDHSVTWSSSDASVASVGATGVVFGRAGGSTRVRVASGDVSDSIMISVMPGACTTALATGSISLAQTRSGGHSAGDCLYQGQAADGWRLDLPSPGVVNISLTSPTSLVELIVTDMQLNIVTYGIGNGSSSQVIAPFPQGSYLLWAISSPGSPLAGYELAAQLHQTPPCSAAAGSIGTGQTVAGQLDGGDCLFLPDYFADSWHLSLTAPTTLQIDLTSTEFDPVLLLTTSAGQWLALNDDAAGSLNSQLIITLPAGDYVLVASTFFPRTTGSYQLAVQSPGQASQRAAGSSASLTRNAMRRSPGERPASAWPVAGKQSSR
jgi:hypothetical protein